MALELVGDGGHVEFANAIIGGRTTFTMEFWLKPTWPPINAASNPWRNMIYGETSGLSGARHQIQIVSDDPTIPDHVRGALACTYWVSPDVPEVFTQPLEEDRWQHIAIVVDQGQMSIYVDGVLADAGQAQSYSGPQPTLFRLGRAFDSIYGRFVIDDVRVSSSARYSSNFLPARVLTPDANTLSLWHFDETTGTATSDATGNEPDATLSPAVVRVIADR